MKKVHAFPVTGDLAGQINRYVAEAKDIKSVTDIFRIDSGSNSVPGVVVLFYEDNTKDE